MELPARELADMSPRFVALLAERGDELCALRLVPVRPEFPKLRNRGLPLRQVYETWFLKQDINPDDYRAFIMPHADDYFWSMIIVSTTEGIFGEVVKGQHAQLTHGDTNQVVYRFRYDFTNWQWSEEPDAHAKTTIVDAVERLHVVDQTKRARLAKEMQSEFAHDYLLGYFEALLWLNNKLYFSDYNRILYKRIPMPPPFAHVKGAITGVVAYKGVVQGTARVVSAENLSAEFNAGDILVTDNTDIRFVPLMRKAGAIVTDRGGMLSHASIVARELKVPCIVGAKVATQKIKTGDRVEVDAEKGIVKIL